MEKSTVVITGSSSGFGFLTALAFAERGFNVIATMRDAAKKEPLLRRARESGCADHIQVLTLDVADPKSIAQFAATLRDVDILVNNAGFARAGFSEDVSPDEFRSQFETNFFGAVALTNAVLPIMRRRHKGRIINVGSISGLVGFPGLSPYVASKYALEGWSECLRLEVAHFGIEVCLVEPTSYRTAIWSTGSQISDKSRSAESAYRDFYDKVERRALENQRDWGDPIEVANKIVTIAGLKKTRLRYPVGKGVRLFIGLKRILPWRWWQFLVLRSFR